MSTGSQGEIYDEIDALSKCQTMEDLVPKLQAILHRMAYFVINSDGAILDAHEEWHSSFEGRLRSDIRSEKRKEAATTRSPAKARDARPPKKLPAGGAGRHKPGMVRGPAPPGGALPSQYEDVPASLLSIMEGTHASLRGSDEHDDKLFARLGRGKTG